MFLSSKDTIEYIIIINIINNNSKSIQTKQLKPPSPLIYLLNYQSFPTTKMRASTTIFFIAGLVSTAFAADTIYFSDENWCVA